MKSFTSKKGLFNDNHSVVTFINYRSKWQVEIVYLGNHV